MDGEVGWEAMRWGRRVHVVMRTFGKAEVEDWEVMGRNVIVIAR